MSIATTMDYRKLEEICDFHAGSTLPLGTEFTGQKSGYLLLKVGDMNLPGNEVFISATREWTPELPKSVTLAPVDSIVFPKRGGAIGTNKKRLLKRDAILDPNMMGVRARKELDTRYLFHWFRQFDLAAIANGSAVPQLNKKDLAPLKLPVPPLSKQKQIADILDTADAICRKRQSAISEVALLTAAVFNDMFGHQLTTARWSQLSDYLVELRYGTSDKSGNSGYTTLRIPNIVRGIIDLGDLKTVEVAEGELQKLRLVEGDMLFVRTNGNPDYVGRCAIYDPNQLTEAGLQADEIIYASYLIRARLQMDRLRPVFLQSLLQTAAGRRNVREKCRTSAGQYNINTKGIGSLQIPDIDIQDQIAFEVKVSSLRPVLERLTAASDAAVSLFNSLVQRAFKGEL